MAEGERAADKTKSFFSNLSGASEGLRKNINSYADNLVSGSHANTADANRNYTTGTVHGGSKSDFSGDAQKAGDMIKQGFHNAENKAGEKRAPH